MKRIIYGVGFFLSALFLCAGFLLSYQITQLRERIYALEESSAEAEQKVSAMADAREQDYIFEKYVDGELKRDYYKMSAYGPERVVLRQENMSEDREAAGYTLKLEEGYIVVYNNADDKVFEYTDILFENLPKELQSEVLLGKSVETPDELYNFLENYSS